MASLFDKVVKVYWFVAPPTYLLYRQQLCRRTTHHRPPRVVVSVVSSRTTIRVSPHLSYCTECTTASGSANESAQNARTSNQEESPSANPLLAKIFAQTPSSGGQTPQNTQVCAVFCILEVFANSSTCNFFVFVWYHYSLPSCCVAVKQVQPFFSCFPKTRRWMLSRAFTNMLGALLLWTVKRKKNGDSCFPVNEIGGISGESVDAANCGWARRCASYAFRGFGEGYQFKGIAEWIGAFARVQFSDFVFGKSFTVLRQIVCRILESVITVLSFFTFFFSISQSNIILSFTFSLSYSFRKCAFRAFR